MNTRDPAFGIWKKEELGTGYDKGCSKIKYLNFTEDSKYTSKLKNLESKLNSLIVKRPNSSTDIKDTNKRRKKLVDKIGIPKRSKFYPEGYGFFYDEQGFFAYGQLTQE